VRAGPFGTESRKGHRHLPLCEERRSIQAAVKGLMSIREDRKPCVTLPGGARNLQ